MNVSAILEKKTTPNDRFRYSPHESVNRIEIGPKLYELLPVEISQIQSSAPQGTIPDYVWPCVLLQREQRAKTGYRCAEA